MTLGIEIRPAETLLVSRARDFLAAGPSDAVPLIAHICQLPAPPRSVAEHMAAALLAAQPEFERHADGLWALAAPARETGATTSGMLAVPETLRSMSYAVVDVETTGGRAYGGDRITEIAAVIVRGGEVCEVFETLVNPERAIPPWITSLTNISWSMVKDAPRFRDICDALTDVLRGHVFVAHNALFDWRFVSSEVARASGQRLDGRRLCTVRLARRLLPQLPRRSLDHVARHYGVEIAARHRAAGDAVATAHVLLRLLDDAAARGCTTWAELDLLFGTSAPRRPRRRSAMPRPVDRDSTA